MKSSPRKLPSWAILGSGCRNLMAISPKKLAVLRIPENLRTPKQIKIAQQVLYRQEQIKIVRNYQPFTTGKAKRRPRQVGA